MTEKELIERVRPIWPYGSGVLEHFTRVLLPLIRQIEREARAAGRVSALGVRLGVEIDRALGEHRPPDAIRAAEIRGVKAGLEAGATNLGKRGYFGSAEIVRAIDPATVTIAPTPNL